MLRRLLSFPPRTKACGLNGAYRRGKRAPNASTRAINTSLPADTRRLPGHAIASGVPRPAVVSFVTRYNLWELHSALGSGLSPEAVSDSARLDQ
jgi:hypothetical protein